MTDKATRAENLKRRKVLQSLSANEALDENELFKSRSTMSDCWSTVIFLFNIWTVFTSLLWASLHILPSDIGPLIHIVIEVILLFEICTRILLKLFLPEAYDTLNLLHMKKGEGILKFACAFIGSFPIMTLFFALNDVERDPDEISVYARLLLIKLLRSFEIVRTITKVEEILFYKKFKTLVLVKFFKNIIKILFVTHFFACIFLFIETSVQNHRVIQVHDDTISINITDASNTTQTLNIPTSSYNPFAESISLINYYIKTI